MLNIKKRLSLIISIFIFQISFFSCTSISPYDYHSYENATSLKSETISLMERGTEEYSKHVDSINDLNLKIEIAYEYEKGKPKNSITTKMWEKLKDPSGGLYGDFIKLWREQNTLGPDYVQAKKRIVEQSFDEIIKLESKKIKE